MDPITDVALPVLTVFAMLTVGMELTPADLRRVARPPGKLAAATRNRS